MNNKFATTSIILITVTFFALGIFYLGYRIGVFWNTPYRFDEEVAASWATVFSCLIAAFGLYLLYKTFISQREELQATQKALRLQKSDSAFFSMLSHLEIIVNGLEGELLSVDPKTGNSYRATLKGRSYLKEALIKLKDRVALANYEYKFNSKTNVFDEYQIVWDKPSVKTGKAISLKEYEDLLVIPCTEFYKDEGSIISYYFRYIEVIIDFIESEFEESDQSSHFKIFRAQLSDDEMGLMLYYILISDAVSFRKKVNNCTLLSSLKYTVLQDKEHLYFYLSQMNPYQKSHPEYVHWKK